MDVETFAFPRQTGRRTVDRIRSFARAALSAEQIVVEQIRVMGRALQANNEPAFYVLESAATPQPDFVVFRGAEIMTDEIRALLTAGIWPAPPQTPSPQTLVARGVGRAFVAVSLWGGENEGPWSPLWRERNLRHGLYGVVISPRGRIGVLLVSRGPDDPPFDAADVAFAVACAPYLEAALDQRHAPLGTPLTAIEAAHFRFDRDGAVEAQSFGGRELLRDLAGGGPGAVQAGLAIIEEANRKIVGAPVLDQAGRASLILGGGQDERAFRAAMFDLALRPVGDPDRAGLIVSLGENGFGHFQLRLHTLTTKTGALERVATLRRLVPPLLLRLRGALAAQASGREIQLLLAVTETGTVKAAAERLRITPATARTLAERLGARVGANGFGDTADRLIELGRMD